MITHADDTQAPVQDAEATSTPKRRSRKPAAEPLTPEQLIQRRMSQRLEEYRAIIARAASGEQLPDEATERALELLEELGLPDLAFTRDVAAFKQYHNAAQAEADARAKRPAQQERMAEVVARIQQLQDELTDLRTEQHTIGQSADNLLAYMMSAQHQLRVEHPHLLEDLESAAAWRLEQQRKRIRPASPLEAAR